MTDSVPLVPVAHNSISVSEDLSLCDPHPQFGCKISAHPPSDQGASTLSAPTMCVGCEGK